MKKKSKNKKLTSKQKEKINSLTTEKKNLISTKAVKQTIMKKEYLILILFIILFIGSGYSLINWQINKKQIDKEITELDKIMTFEEINEPEDTQIINPPKKKSNDYLDYIKMPFIDADLENLKKINKDTVGFISINGTNINYPIVQASNNEYYLNHSFKGKYNKAGWVFMDYRNNAYNFDSNTILYGHSRVDGTMFGTLKNILKSSWIDNKDNYIIKLSTITENTLWQVFSIYTIPVETYYMNIHFNNDKKYNKWLQTMLGRSNHNFNAAVDAKDKVLTLSTCYKNDKYRVIMHAKLIKSVAKNNKDIIFGC